MMLGNFILVAMPYALPTLVVFTLIVFVWICVWIELHDKDSRRRKFISKGRAPIKLPKRRKPVADVAGDGNPFAELKLTRRRTLTRPDNPKWTYVLAFGIAFSWLSFFLGWPGGLYATFGLFGGMYVICKIPSRWW